MKLFCIALAIFAQGALFAANVPVEWTVDVESLAVHEFSARRGETLEIEVNFRHKGQPFPLEGNWEMFYQTNGMGSAYFAFPVETDGSVARITFTPEMDPGEERIVGFIGRQSVNYRAAFALRFYGSPSQAPSRLPVPVGVISAKNSTFAGAVTDTVVELSDTSRDALLSLGALPAGAATTVGILLAALAAAVATLRTQKQNTLSTKQLAAANSGITAPLVSKLNALPSEVPDAAKVLPRYELAPTENLDIYPSATFVLDEPFKGYSLSCFSSSMMGGTLTIEIPNNPSEPAYARDFILVVEYLDEENPMTIEWPNSQNPFQSSSVTCDARTDEETDLMCDFGRNVYYISEYAPNYFVVSRFTPPVMVMLPDEELPPEEV
jgi:hypothetical protein